MTHSDPSTSHAAGAAGDPRSRKAPGVADAPTDAPRLVAERTEPGIYVATNDRGGRVRIGAPDARHAFTPGELLQLAVAGCSAISAEANLVHHLGDNFEASLEVGAVKDDGENRYSQVRTSFAPAMADLEPERVEKLVGRLERAIERLCTVGRTLEHGADHHLEITPR